MSENQSIRTPLVRSAEPESEQGHHNRYSYTGHTLMSRSPTLEALHDYTASYTVFGRPSVDEHGRQVVPTSPAGTSSALSDQPGGAGTAAAPKPREKALEAKLQFAYNLSWVVNILLFAAKAVAYYMSGSKAVLASLVDSMVDLVSQGIIFVAEWKSKAADPRFPVGKARLETIGVLACACIMSVSTMEVVQDSSMTLYRGLAHGELPELDAGVVMYAVLGVATAAKLVCWVLCVALKEQSDSMMALAEDHLNDVVSNVGAAATVVVAANFPPYWWADPAGGIAISVFILWRWYDIAKSQVDKIVGRGAPEDMLQQLRAVAEAHHDQLEVDCLRAYHFGSRYMVEAEVVMPVTYTLRQVHDISLELQIRLEAIAMVERAFVHVDYQKRDQPEHRTDRVLAGLPVVEEEPLTSPHTLHASHSGSMGRRTSGNGGGSSGASVGEGRGDGNV